MSYPDYGHYEPVDLAHEADMRALKREQLRADISAEEADEDLEWEDQRRIDQQCDEQDEHYANQQGQYWGCRS